MLGGFTSMQNSALRIVSTLDSLSRQNFVAIFFKV